MPTKHDFIEAMAKHLPPSASELHLLDIGGVCGDVLKKRRPDVEVIVASLNPEHWELEANSVDAVVAYDTLLKPTLLQAVLRVMRSGGRFTVVNPLGEVAAQWVETLENAGYIRILVEPAFDEHGVLIRGEKAHITEDTLERVESVAEQDSDLLDIDSFRGRYVHLLIIQTPNIPVWKRTADDPIEWHAIAVKNESDERLLGFSSLPKAVSFMQAAVLEGFIRDVNKVGKFSKEVARAWQMETLLNPTLASVQSSQVSQVAINPDTAEASDE